MISWHHRTQAFSLIELLIGMALVGIVLTAVLAVNASTTRSASSLQIRNDLLGETQTAQNYVAAKLRDAAYVFPTGTTLVLGTSGGYSTRKPGTSSGTWTVGTDPIIAFITPPRTATPAAGACNAGVPDTCYTFYAYYPVQRSAITGSGGGAGANNPGVDARNDASAWVLMEYRVNYGSGTVIPSGITPTPALTSGLNGAQGRIVLDYLRTPAAGETLFSQVDSTQVGVSSVTLQLATQRIAAETTRVPGAGRYSVTIYPRNVGQPVVPN